MVKRVLSVVGVFFCIVKIMAQSFLGVLLSGILSTHCNVSYEKTIIDYIDTILLAPVTEEKTVEAVWDFRWLKKSWSFMAECWNIWKMLRAGLRSLLLVCEFMGFK